MAGCCGQAMKGDRNHAPVQTAAGQGTQLSAQLFRVSGEPGLHLEGKRYQPHQFLRTVAVGCS